MRSLNDRIEYVYIIGEHDLKTNEYTGYYKIGKTGGRFWNFPLEGR